MCQCVTGVCVRVCVHAPVHHPVCVCVCVCVCESVPSGECVMDRLGLYVALNIQTVTMEMHEM